MEEKNYAATYEFGKSVVHIVAPPPMTEEEREKVLKGYYEVAWTIVRGMLDRDTKIE